MDQDKTSPPQRSATDIRREREADALRANLRKRKEQRRAREANDVETPRDEPPKD